MHIFLYMLRGHCEVDLLQSVKNKKIIDPKQTWTPDFHFTFFIAGELADLPQENQQGNGAAGTVRGTSEIITFWEKDSEATISQYVPRYFHQAITIRILNRKSYHTILWEGSIGNPTPKSIISIPPEV